MKKIYKKKLKKINKFQIKKFPTKYITLGSSRISNPTVKGKLSVDCEVLIFFRLVLFINYKMHHICIYMTVSSS